MLFYEKIIFRIKFPIGHISYPGRILQGYFSCIIGAHSVKNNDFIAPLDTSEGVLNSFCFIKNKHCGGNRHNSPQQADLWIPVLNKSALFQKNQR
jgi:hypothetical protein